MKLDKRTKLNRGPIPANPRDISQWTKDQIRAAGPWSKHEIESMIIPLTAAYDWVPDWIGDMTPQQVNALIMDYYNSN